MTITVSRHLIAEVTRFFQYDIFRSCSIKGIKLAPRNFFAFSKSLFKLNSKQKKWMVRDKQMEYPLRLPKEVFDFIRSVTKNERRQFSVLLNSDELKQSEETDTIVNGSGHGEPKLYIGTTLKGLNLEIPNELVNAVFKVLVEEITPTRIELFLSGPTDYSESVFTEQQFLEAIDKDGHSFSHHYALIEMDDNEIITSGEGCISIVFSEVIMSKRNAIATRILGTCGYTHTFNSDKFYAVLWETELEIKEKK